MIAPDAPLWREDECEELCAETPGGLCGAVEKVETENGTAGEDFHRL